jgi:hypothetical protein
MSLSTPADRAIAEELYGDPFAPINWQGGEIVVDLVRLRPEWRSVIFEDTGEESSTLDKALTVLKADAVNFSTRFIPDYQVRRQYIATIEKFANETLAAVNSGELTPKAAERIVQTMRNEIMEWARFRSSDIGRAYAQSLKAAGLTLEQLHEKYAQKLFQRTYTALAEAEQNQVALAIVEAAGRARPGVLQTARRLAFVGKVLWVFTAAVVVYDIATADDKVEAIVRNGVEIGGGVLGGAGGGAVAGLACGPGAPICVTIGVFVGGALGALGAGYLLDWVEKRTRDVVDDVSRKTVNGIYSIYGIP